MLAGLKLGSIGLRET
jgi:hypothetical protein